jgi:ribosomal protein S18 acetylase RimI-like enzyme
MATRKQHLETTDPLFEVGEVRVHALQESGIARLQAFFDANPAYFIAVNGEPARPDEARQEFFDTPPPTMSYSRQTTLAFDDAQGRMQAMAMVVVDLMAAGTWHIGLFIVDGRLHGSGAAGAYYRGLEDWIRAQGALWLRLGVLVGNTRAERFWERMGYTELCRRDGLVYGRLTHTARVMAKTLGGRSLDEYLARVPRDRPEG